MVRHIVLFAFKDSVTENDIGVLADELMGLKDKIPGIVNFNAGMNSSPEGLNKDFTFGFTMDFASPQARDEYLPHPAHQAVVEKLKLMLKDGMNGALAFDIEI